MRAYVFPGQGMHRKGMGQGLFEEFQDLTEQADDVLGYSIKRLCLEDPDRSLSNTKFAQPAIYVTNALHYLRQLKRDPAEPDYLAGHSLGEFNALLAAKAFDFRTGLKLVQQRATVMGRAKGGAMAVVVGISEQTIHDALKKHNATGVTIANCNTHNQFVLSGSRKEIEHLKPIFEQLSDVETFGLLRTSGAFHSPHMEDARLEFQAFLECVEFAELATPVISNVTAQPYQRSTIKPLLSAQITKPVRWSESIQYLRRAGVSSFLEIGQGKVLTGLIEKIMGQELPSHSTVELHSTTAPPRVSTESTSGSPLVINDRLDRWQEYRDERVLRLLRDCTHGAVTVEKAVRMIRERI